MLQTPCTMPAATCEDVPRSPLYPRCLHRESDDAHYAFTRPLDRFGPKFSR